MTTTNPHIMTVALLALGVVVACSRPSAGPDLPPEPPSEGEVAPFEEVWSVTLDAPDGYVASTIQPIPLDGGERYALLLATPTRNTLYHVDPADGTVLDSFDVRDEDMGYGKLASYRAAPYLDGESAVLSIDNWPLRIDLRDGTVEWVVRGNYPMADLGGGRLISGESAGFGERLGIGVIDAATGDVERVVHPFPASHPSTRGKGGYEGALVDERDPDRFLATLHYIDADSIAYTLGLRFLYDLRADSIVWSDTVPTRGAPIAMHEPVLYDGVVVQAEFDTVRGYALGTGEVLWTYNAWYLPVEPGVDVVNLTADGDHFVATGPVLDAATGRVYLASTNAYQVCLDAATGREVWRGGKGQGSWLQTFGLVGGGMLSTTTSPGPHLDILSKHTGEVLGRIEASPGALFDSAPYYDEATGLLIVSDGVTVRGLRPRFEVPGA